MTHSSAGGDLSIPKQAYAEQAHAAPSVGAEPSPTLVVYGSELEAYDFGLEHPMQPDRYRLTMSLIEQLGMLDRPSIQVVSPRPATLTELLTVHSYPYIQAVRRAQNIALEKEPPVDLGIYGLGSADNPLFTAMHDAAALAVGAGLLAVEAILRGEVLHAYNPAGGLHHALRARASGFCIYNDCAVAIRRAVDAGLRVAYVDLDAHHGDGVQKIFYREPRVLTISIHESGRFLFPWTGAVTEQGEGPGEGTAINIPLPPQAGDRAYLAAMEEVIEPAVRAFRPDLLVTQTGCDAHWSDPLTHLATTLPLYPKLIERLHSVAHEVSQGRWLILGGGGYDSVSITPRAWAAVFAAATAHPMPDALPPEWLAQVAGRGRVRTPSRLLADPGPEFQALGRACIHPVLEKLRGTVVARLERGECGVRV